MSMIRTKEGLKLRYLWTKRPHEAFLIVVSIKHKNHPKWLIPIPVWVVDETIGAVQDIARVFEWIMKRTVKREEENRANSENRSDSEKRTDGGNRADGDKRDANKWRRYVAGMPVSATLQAVNDIIRELRVQGRFRMVAVEGESIRIYVDFV